MTVYALRLDNGVDTAARVRMADMLALPAGAAPLTSKSALRPDGGGAVSVVAGTMNVQAAPFAAWVQGSVSVAQGGYPFVSDAAVTLTLAAGHASLSRTDTIAGVVRDNSFDGSGSVDARVIVVQGTPGSGAPALPANCVPLRDVVVPAGLSAGNGGLQTSNLGTDRRVYLDSAPKTLDYGTGTATVQSGSAGPTAIPGLSRTVQVPSTTSALFITLELDWSGDAGSTIGAFRPRVDGVDVGPDMVLNLPGGRYPVSKTWRVAGLSAGNHAITATVSYGAGSKLDIVGVTSALIVDVRPS